MTLAGLKATSVSFLDVSSQLRILSTSSFLTLKPSQFLTAYSNKIPLSSFAYVIPVKSVENSVKIGFSVGFIYLW